MRAITPDDDFTEAKECDYKDEHYSVRDNGAIMRHANNERKRPNDEKWTFGKKNDNGYMMFGGERVHIIVANAFHGVHDSKVYVVDHIDTNRCNNRPDNLRWFTRLENVLNNPVTRKRIEYLCGGNIQKFLDNPSCLRDLTGTNSDLAWMRTVTSEEAKNAYERVMNWAKKPSEETPSFGGKLGEWIYQKESSKMPNNNINIPMDNVSGSFQNGFDREYQSHKNAIHPITGMPESILINSSITPTALQGNWSTPTKFLCCPSQVSATPLEDYYNNLKKGETYFSNNYGESSILDFAISEDKQHLWVLTVQQGEIKPWGIIEVVMHDNHFLHISRHTYFSENGGRKEFALYQGKKWEGEDSIDDYC